MLLLLIQTMKSLQIGLLSDTHGYLHPGIFTFFEDVDEIWHAGDIGGMSTARELEAFKPLFAVYGNIDDHLTRTAFPEMALFERSGLRCLMMHIGGYPGRYTPKAREGIMKHRPHLFISGHSHILKVMPDNTHKLLHINPGAAGYQGMHHKITFVRFRLENGKPSALEVFEAERRKV